MHNECQIHARNKFPFQLYVFVYDSIDLHAYLDWKSMYLRKREKGNVHGASQNVSCPVARSIVVRQRFSLSNYDMKHTAVNYYLRLRFRFLSTTVSVCIKLVLLSADRAEKIDRYSL